MRYSINAVCVAAGGISGCLQRGDHVIAAGGDDNGTAGGHGRHLRSGQRRALDRVRMRAGSRLDARQDIVVIPP